jgi:hypothetical protein
MNSPEQNAEPRSGIPSVPTSAIHWFYALFSIGTIYLTAANTLEQAARVKATGWLEIQSIATVQLLQSAGASIAGAAIIVEGVSMVLAAIIRERNRRKDEEEARKREEETLRREGGDSPAGAGDSPAPRGSAPTGTRRRPEPRPSGDPSALDGVEPAPPGC